MTAEPTQLPDLPWVRGDDQPGTTRAADRGFGWQRHGSGTSGMPLPTGGTGAARDGQDDDLEEGGEEDCRAAAEHPGTARAGVRHAGRRERHAAAVPPVPQRHAGKPEPTHHIIVPDRAEVVPGDRHAARTAAVPVRRLSDTVRDWTGELRFVSETPGSLRDHLRFAQEARYGGYDNQFIRCANVVFFYAITAPLLSVVYLFAWAFLMRLNRSVTLLVAVLVLAPVLNGIPVLHWLIPDLIDFTTWFGAGEASAP